MMCNEIVPYSKQIPLTRGRFATVNYHWYQFLIQWRWHLDRDRKGGEYASSSLGANGSKMKMHRLILGLMKGDKHLVDHKDHNGLNNICNNLRIANFRQNAANTLSKRNSTSRYLGVSSRYLNKNKNNKRWEVQISIYGKGKYIGQFPYTPEGEIQAAKAYDKIAIKVHGEFANLNFPS